MQNLCCCFFHLQFFLFIWIVLCNVTTELLDLKFKLYLRELATSNFICPSSKFDEKYIETMLKNGSSYFLVFFLSIVFLKNTVLKMERCIHSGAFFDESLNFWMRAFNWIDLISVIHPDGNRNIPPKHQHTKRFMNIVQLL